MDTEMDIAKATQCGTVLCILNQKISSSSSSSLSLSLSSVAVVVAVAVVAATTLMVKMETETDQNGAKQGVKQLKHVKQRDNEQHYSHTHHQPPIQQYKLKNWSIVIILKFTFVALDSWTCRIGC